MWGAVRLPVIALATVAGLALGPATALAAGGLSWSAPALINHNPPYGEGGTPTAVSCPSVRLCVAVDDTGDVIASRTPTGPASSWKVAHVEGTALSGISCPSIRLCVAVDDQGYVLTSREPTGRRWSSVHVYRRGWLSGFEGISCPSRSFCVAVAGARAYASRDPTGGAAAWKSVAINFSGYARRFDAGLTGISCSSSSFCLAVDSAGEALVSTRPIGGAWRTIQIDRSPSRLSSISCPARTLCVATDDSGHVLSSTDPAGGRRTWRTTDLDANACGQGCGSVAGVSCPSRLCVATGDGALFVSRHPTGGVSTWRRVSVTGGWPEAVGCPSANLCVALGTLNLGNGLGPRPTVASGRPTKPARVWHSRLLARVGVNALSSVFCPSRLLCVATGDGGHLLSSASPASGAPAWRSTQVGTYPLTGLSCASPSFCVVAVSSFPTDEILTSRRPSKGIWTMSPGPFLDGISCPTSSLCVGYEGGDILTSSDPTGGPGAWHLAFSDPAESPQCDKDGYYCPDTISSLVCRTIRLCVAVDQVGNVISSADPAGGQSAWRLSTPVSGPCQDAEYTCSDFGVSCPSTRFCLVSDQTAILTSTDPADDVWKPWRFPNGAPLVFPGSCPSATFCVAVGGPEGGLPGYPRILVSTDPGVGSVGWRLSATDRYGVTDISCASPSLCVAVDQSGDVVVGRRRAGVRARGRFAAVELPVDRRSGGGRGHGRPRVRTRRAAAA
jgi:hypothetical protein